MSESPFDKLPKEELDALQEVLPPIAPTPFHGKTPQEILDSWRTTALMLKNTYNGSKAEYALLLDVRRAIEDALRSPRGSHLVKTRAAIDSIDQTFKANTVDYRRPIHETGDETRDWYFLRAPKLSGGLIAGELYGETDR